MPKHVFISNVLPQAARDLIPKDGRVVYNETDTPLPKSELMTRLRVKDGRVCPIITTGDGEAPSPPGAGAPRAGCPPPTGGGRRRGPGGSGPPRRPPARRSCASPTS